ncbi:hypothetical protein WMF30_33135 [Sorangium sp. So ce134]
MADSLALLDPPAHTKLRALVSRAFTSRVVPRVEPLVRAAARRFAESIAAGQPVEVQEHFCSELPGVAIAELLGLDPALMAERRLGLEELLPRIRGLRAHERGSAWSTSLFSRNQAYLWMEFDRA